MATKNGNGNVFTTVEMSYKKETPGTFMFSNDEQDCPIPSIYIRKASFKGKEPPKNITLVVQVHA
jgi:hypothetical protein